MALNTKSLYVFKSITFMMMNYLGIVYKFCVWNNWVVCEVAIQSTERGRVVLALSPGLLTVFLFRSSQLLEISGG